MDRSDRLAVASALSQLEGRTRREWKSALETLRLLDVTLSELVSMTAGDGWKWLGWNANQFRDWRSALEVSRNRVAQFEDSGIDVVTTMDEHAPDWLHALPATPWLFYGGDLAVLDRVTLGFSGQRDAGDQALAITDTLAMEAARLGYTVVSGGARGVDMAAHAAALAGGGSTAVILPQGLGTWKAPHGLSSQQAAPRVLAVSEDVPWEPWNTESAMRRNRMIVDLSRIFTVPQSGTSGGSHSTGMYALKHGRVTYVPDLGPDYPGNGKLIRHGARPLDPRHGFDLAQMLEESIPEESPSQASLF